MRRGAAVTVVAAILLSVGVVEKAAALDSERTEAAVSIQTTEERTYSAEARGAYLEGAIESAEEERAQLAAVIEVRPAFVAELSALSTALSAAGGKVDTAAHRASALSTQQTVLAEQKDPAVVIAATATIHALTDKVKSEVSAWEGARRAQSVRPTGPAWSSSGPDGYARVRAALDRVGGGGVGLYESSSCAGGTAPACANSDGYIKYRADIADWSSSRLHWAMAHELAHIYQFRIWGALTSSPSYASLFGGDPEFLANCMAVVRGFAGSVGCNGAQQEWAAGVWVGSAR